MQIQELKPKLAELKVKIKSLTAEAGIIRADERRMLAARKDPKVPCEIYEKYGVMRVHRIRDVRREQRLSLLAYAFIRGRSYSTQEDIRRLRQGNAPDWKRVKSLVVKFGGRNVTEADLMAWGFGTAVSPFARPKAEEVPAVA